MIKYSNYTANSDLFSCTFINLGTKEKIRRFLVVDEVQMLLVEPSVGRMGWGVVNLTWYLQVSPSCGISFSRLVRSIFIFLGH